MRGSIFLFLVLSIISCKKEDNAVVKPSTPVVVGKTYSALELSGFKQLVFNAPGGDGAYVRKWRSKEVYVYMVDTSFSYINAELDSIISDLNLLTAAELVLKKTTNRLIATLQIYLTNKHTFFEAEPAASLAYQTFSRVGFTYAFWGGDKNIDSAVIFNDITRQDNNTDLANRYVMRHEMMHALGFLGHVTLPEFDDSCLFDVFNFVTVYSSFDKRMISLLYNPAIKAGMREIELNAALVNL